MKYLFYTTKRRKMKKIELNLFNFLIIVLMLSVQMNGFAKNNIESLLKGGDDGTIACNDTVQIVMDLDCITEIQPDQLLEGNYPDFGIFEVNVIDQNGISIGNTVTSEHIDMLLVAEVLDTTTGNRCWSHIDIKDKYAPQLECDTIYSTCFDDFIPNSLLPHNFRFAFQPNVVVPDEDTLRMSFAVGKVPGAIISDINFRLNIEHERILDLEAYVISPDGDTVNLFDLLTCGNANLDIVLDDEAEQTDVDLSAACCPNDCAVKGKFKPVGNLSDYDGKNPTGIWTLVVIDKNAGEEGVIKDFDILFKQNGGFINFPIPLTSSVPIFLEENKYLVESGFDACGEVILTYTDKLIEQGCDTNLTGYIEREWVATDESDNFTICTQIINIIRTGTSFLVFPPNFDNIDEPALSCQSNNPEFYPEPNITGSPGDELCNMVNITYDDQVIDICSGSFKIIRHWKVSEMCSGEVIEHDQIISVLDTHGPSLAKLPDLSLPTDALECNRDLFLKFPEILSDCSDYSLMTLEVGYQLLDEFGNPETPQLLTSNIELLPNGSYLLSDAPIGNIKISYIATDDCGNISTRTQIITIYDNDPPVAVCDEHTKVSLGTDGEAKVDAFVIDDGSHDNCTEITYKVRRMTPNCISTDNQFKDIITFCCDDVETTQMVELQVTDEGGRSNSCMAEVLVEDKIPPVLKCPSDITLKCNDDYTDLALTFEPIVFDNCGYYPPTYTDVENISQCFTGTVTRTWHVEAHNGDDATCVQIITLDDKNEFVGSDIIWPIDRTYYECIENFEPFITGEVTYQNEDFCSMVATRYDDEVFNVVDGSCKKILRHWEVIDWCTFDENDPEASTWRHTQVIMLENTVAPEFDELCEEKTLCTYGECAGQIEYEKTATDDCTLTEDLNWTYRVDIDNDGTWDLGPYFTNKLSGVYPNGTHRVAWTVEDGCGNMTSCEEIIIVKDCKKPTPLCITQLATVVMNQVGMVTVCAEDFNLGNCDDCPTGSYDNCTPSEELIYSFSGDVEDSCRTYTCDSLPNGQQKFFTVEMWVTDQAGNQDYCTVYLDLQDNEGNACPDTIVGSTVSGLVYDPFNSPLSNVELKLETNEGVKLFNYSNSNGKYEFENVNEDIDYTLSANLETEYLLGVTTLDLVLIQKHILGIKTFDKPYKYIAADANKSRTVSASDILTIRKVILGQKEDFGNGNKSWGFVRDGSDIRENKQILSVWNDEFDLNEFTYGSSINWVGVKVGDINNSSKSLLESGLIEGRNTSTTTMILNDKSYTNNQKVKVDVSFADMKELVGGQFTLNFDTDKLSFSKIIPNESLINSNSFGLTKVLDGNIAVSWVKPENIEYTSDLLFSVVFNAKSNNTIANSITLSNNITKIEAYNSNLEILDIVLNYRDSNDYNSEYTLYQNSPNPFNNQTTVLFDIPKDQEATITFTDITGRVLKKITDEYKKGKNSVEVSFNNSVSGVIYYKLETGQFTQTKKMVRIR